MKKVLLTVLAALALVFVGVAPANAAGSNGPTPYQVTMEGIYLPAGDVFTDGSHVNVKDDKGKTYSIHFEAKYAEPDHAEWRNRPFDHTDPRNQFYGQSFIPWAAMNIEQKEPYCVTWVQIHTNKGYNQHFGEGGQEPVGTGCNTPPDLVEPGAWTNMTFDCNTKVGDVINRTREVKITRYKWDGTVKSVETITETGTYTVVESDLWNIDCRTEVNPVIPTIKIASGTCVDEQWEYLPAVVTLPAVENGKWSAGPTLTLERGQSTTVTFSVTDDSKFFVGDAPVPAEQTFWTAVKDGNTIVFTLSPNVVNETDCRLANSGLDGNPLLLVGGATILAGSGAWLVLRRKKA